MDYNMHGEQIYYLHDDINDLFTIFHFGRTEPNSGYSIFQTPTSPYHIFEFVIDGTGYVKHSDKTEQVYKGDFYFLNKSGSALFYSDSEQPYDKYFISVYGKLIDNLVSAFFNDRRFVIVHTGVLAPEFSRIFGELNDLLNGIYQNEIEGEARSLRLLEAANLVFRMLTFAVGTQRFDITQPDMTLAAMIRRWLDDNINVKTTLEVAAKHFNISVTHLIRVFRERYGDTPKQYIICRQIACAKMMLTNTQLSVKEISDRLGFADANYFSAVFKKLAAVTPSEYRTSEERQNYIIDYKLKV